MKIGITAVLACLVVVLVIMLGFALDTSSTRGWQYNPGEEIQLGCGRSVVLSSESSARIDVPMEHVPGDLDPAFLSVRIYGPSDEVYDVFVDTQTNAEKAIEEDKRLAEDGEGFNRRVESFIVDDMRFDLTVALDLGEVLVWGYVWMDDCDPIYIRASDNKALSRLIAQGGSVEEIAQLILDGVGLCWNGNRLLE